MLGTTVANLVLWSVRERLADNLTVDEENKLRDKRATMADLTTLTHVSDLTWFNDIPGLIRDILAEIGVKIPQEQVGSSEVTVQPAKELGECSVTLIPDPQKAL